MSVAERAPVVGRVADEAAIRRTLRAQIARMERELQVQATGSFPALPLPARPAPARQAAPRLLSLGELEEERDRLAGQVRDLSAQRREHHERQSAARALLERMLLAPGEHRWVRVANADLGEPGCKHFHVRPRLGLIGMLAGWWHVKVSSGCPLGVPGAARPPAVLRDAGRSASGGSSDRLVVAGAARPPAVLRDARRSAPGS